MSELAFSIKNHYAQHLSHSSGSGKTYGLLNNIFTCLTNGIYSLVELFFLILVLIKNDICIFASNNIIQTDIIHPVKIDDTTRNGKKIINDLRRYRKGVEFENPAETGIVPEGYVTSEEFRKIVKEKVQKFCDDNEIVSEQYITSEEFKVESRKDLDEICKKHGISHL